MRTFLTTAALTAAATVAAAGFEEGSFLQATAQFSGGYNDESGFVELVNSITNSGFFGTSPGLNETIEEFPGSISASDSDQIFDSGSGELGASAQYSIEAAFSATSMSGSASSSVFASQFGSSSSNAGFFAEFSVTDTEDYIVDVVFGGGAGYFAISNEDGDILFETEEDFSGNLVLEAGVLYLIEEAAANSDGQFGPASASISFSLTEVPAPGTVALLPLAAAAATRRRR